MSSSGATSRWQRWCQAEEFFDRLYPQLRWFRRLKLIELAVSYWEDSERYS